MDYDYSSKNDGGGDPAVKPRRKRARGTSTIDSVMMGPWCIRSCVEVVYTGSRGSQGRWGCELTPRVCHASERPALLYPQTRAEGSQGPCLFLATR